ncbi:MAG: ion transporter [Prevotella sp.]|jgi:voltage-gated potassium channel|nr:ion transporter [Prevotella sp.]
MKLRDRIHWLVEPRNESKGSRTYDFIMLIAIAIGILPLMFRTQIKLFWYFDLISGICFIVDYILRWSTADYDSKKSNWLAFVIYPFTPMAIIDLLSILPIFNLISPTFKVVRFSRLLKILRIFKVIRYYEPLVIISAVIRKQSKILCTVMSLAIFYIFITALIMFNAEEEINPETGTYLFDSFFDAFYWAACTLTTVGYGDLYPISDTGRVISIISAMVGIAIIALPSGIITAGYMEELRNRKKELKNNPSNR